MAKEKLTRDFIIPEFLKNRDDGSAEAFCMGALASQHAMASRIKEILLVLKEDGDVNKALSSIADAMTEIVDQVGGAGGVKE